MKKQLGIPEIRDCLHVLADLEVAAGRSAQGALLHYLAEATRRRRAVRRAPVQRAARPPRKLVDAIYPQPPRRRLHGNRQRLWDECRQDIRSAQSTLRRK